MSDQAQEDPTDLEQLARTVVAARKGWVTLEQTGGVLTIPGIASRWGVERGTVRGYIQRRADFPLPVSSTGDSDLWLAAEIDLWRATPRRPGRPPKTKNNTKKARI